MKLLFILLSLQSCASYQGAREYTQTTHYRVKGVKCPTTHYFDYDSQSCLPVLSHYINAEDNPSGVSIDQSHTYNSSPDFKKPTNKPEKPKGRYNPTRPQKKINCRFILDNINKCTL